MRTCDVTPATLDHAGQMRHGINIDGECAYYAIVLDEHGVLIHRTEDGAYIGQAHNVSDIERVLGLFLLCMGGVH